MACCTTIPPLNNKRKNGGVFDMPRSAKQRRPLNNNTMTTTFASAQTKQIFIDAESPNKTSVFQMKNQYSPLGSLFENSSNLDTDNANTSATTDEGQFKNELMERIRHEAKRLIKRKQITLSTTLTTSTIDSESLPDQSAVRTPLPTTASPCSLLSKKSMSSTSNLNNVNDLPIFSMSQVNAICERMLGERETAIREQYDKILTQKMSEQYDAFVKFTHEQIQRRFATSQCSYVS
jgi:hypothetical protein